MSSRCETHNFILQDYDMTISPDYDLIDICWGCDKHFCDKHYN